MTEKDLRKQVIGSNVSSNVLLTIKIICELTAQILVIYLIGKLVTKSLSLKDAYLVFIAIIAAFVFKAGFNYFSVKTAHDKAYTKLTELRLKITEHLNKLSLGFFKEHSTGELTNIIENDVEKVEVYLAHGLPEIMAATLIPGLIFIIMLCIDWRLALAMVAGLPFMFLTQFLSKKTMEKTMQKYFYHENKMRAEMMEYVKNISVLKAFSKEEEVSEKTLKSAREYVYWIKKSMGSITIPMGLTDVFMETGAVFVMILGSLLLAGGSLTVTQFILAIVLSMVFIAGICKIATLHHFQMVFNHALKSIGTVLNAPLKTKETAENTHDTLLCGDIECNNVSFGYGKNGFALHNINLKIKENSLTAFVGSSGCGKSTLANLIMGFWDAEKGTVTVGGKDISKYPQTDLSSLIASVNQDVVLFNISIFENIALGKKGANKNEVIEAAKKARCHDFISKLPRGYDTKVGEMGVKLSGGEKQRISIARMIIKNAPILILDEAMAAVDSENEKLIGQAIEDLRKDKTLITIAHHLNTVKNADQIIVMDKGAIVGKGTHDELISCCPLYKDMVKAQNKVDTWDLKKGDDGNV